MSDMLSTIVSYIPTSLMDLLLHQETLPNAPTRRSFQAAVLFADVSGFTPLTEALAQKGDEGPEEITRLLNRYFGRMISLLESEGGDVVKFSGDALTVLFAAGDEPLANAVKRAEQAAHAMQGVMQELAPVQTSVGPVELALKVGIGGGEVLALQIGGVFRRWEYVITGEGLRQAAIAEGKTARGGVTLSDEMQALVNPVPLEPKALKRAALREREDLPEIEARLKRFLPGAVRSWMVDEVLHDWLGVLRSMSVLFIGVAGIDYESDDGLQQIHEFLRSAQETIYRYQGSINKLAVDDKGTIFLVLFGAPPFAHADDPLRAVRCALDLAEIAQEQGLVLRTGVTTGRVFAGPVGSDLRREYTVMGDAVNLAARLMGKAAPNRALCDIDTMQATHHQVEYDTLDPVMLKGKSAATQIFEPQRLSDTAVRSSDEDVMIGRAEELASLIDWADKAMSGTNHMVLLEADAGIGKTLLLRTFSEQAQDLGLRCVEGAGQSLEQLSAYWAWQGVFLQLFELRDIESQAARQVQVEAMMAELLPEQVMLPLLNDVLGLAFPDNEHTHNLEPAIRQESLRSLLVSIVGAWARHQPTCLILDNLQWFDSLSWELLLHVCRAMQDAEDTLPLMIAMASRPIGAQAFTAPQMESLKAIPTLLHLSLPLLTSEETLALVAARLGCSPTHLPDGLDAFVYARSDGNPLFAGELIDYLLRRELLEERGDGGNRHFLFDAKGEVQLLPDSLEGLLLARVDQLPPGMQLVLKVASVVGRRFSFGPLLTLLRGHTQTTDRELQEQLESLHQQGLTVPEFSDDMLVYLFKNLATQEVTYRSLLYQQRRELHRTFAEWLEATVRQELAEQLGEAVVETDSGAVEAPPRYLMTLAHHWRHAGQGDRELWYQQRAGAHAAEQYANNEALQCYNRALALAPSEPEARISLLLAREALFARLGQRDAQREDLNTLQEMSAALTPEQQLQCALREATFALATSSFDASKEHAERAAMLAEQLQDFDALAQAYHQVGSTLLRMGKIPEAREQLMLALDIAHNHEVLRAEATTLRVLGNSYAMRGEMAEALKRFKAALELHEQIDDYPGAIRSQNNIGLVLQYFGDGAAALEAFEQAFAHAKELGSPPLESLVIGNLSTAYTESGQYQYAEELLKQGLRLGRMIDSPVDVGMSHLFLGENLVRQGRYDEAIASLGDALSAGQEINHRYLEGYAFMYLAEALCFARELASSQERLVEAVAVAEEIQQKEIEAEGALVRGHLCCFSRDFEAASQAYDKAAACFEGLSFQAGVIEAKAGSVRSRCALEYHQCHSDPVSMAIIEEILAHLKDQGHAGMREPFWVWLTCIQALQTDEMRYQATLEQAHSALMDRANTLEAEASQRYLAIPHHAALLQLLPAKARS